MRCCRRSRPAISWPWRATRRRCPKYAMKGVQVRQADYDDPASLAAALKGVDRVLLISGNAVGQRGRQHGNVIEAAKKAGASYLAYTSILNARGIPSSRSRPSTRRPRRSSSRPGSTTTCCACRGTPATTSAGLRPRDRARDDLRRCRRGSPVDRQPRRSRRGRRGGAGGRQGRRHPTSSPATRAGRWMNSPPRSASTRSKPVKYVNQSEADFTKTLEGAGPAAADRGAAGQH